MIHNLIYKTVVFLLQYLPVPSLSELAHYIDWLIDYKKKEYWKIKLNP